MTPEEQIAKMTKAINQAIKVMGDPFGSTPNDATQAIQGLRDSMKKESAPAAAVAPAPALQKPQ